MISLLPLIVLYNGSFEKWSALRDNSDENKKKQKKQINDIITDTI